MYVDEREVNSYRRITELINDLSRTLESYISENGNSSYAVINLNGNRLTLREVQILINGLKRSTSIEDARRMVQLEKQLEELIRIVKTKLMMASYTDSDLSEIKRVLEALTTQLRYGRDLPVIRANEKSNWRSLTWDDVERIQRQISNRQVELQSKRGYRF